MDENEVLEPIATEAGLDRIVDAIKSISSLENALRAERAASVAETQADNSRAWATGSGIIQSGNQQAGTPDLYSAKHYANEAEEYYQNAKDWATKIDTYVDTETITIPPEQEGGEPTTETIQLFSARYYAALAEDFYNNMTFDNAPTQNSTNLLTSGAIYDALDLKADKSTTYTKTEIDTALGNVQGTLTFDSTPTQNSTNPVTSGGLYTAFLNVQSSLTFDNSPTLNSDNPVKSGGIYTALAGKLDTLTFDNTPTANSNNPVKSSGIKTALDAKQDTLTFDSTPTLNSTNPVTSGGVYSALLNIPSGGGNVTVDTTITENSQNPVTSAAIYAALLGAGGGGGSIIVDSVPTQNSTNAVQSGGVYDALLNISGGFEVFEIDSTKLTPNANFTCNPAYYNDTAGATLSYHWSYSEVTYLKNSIPCVSGQVHHGSNYAVVIVSPVQKGTEMYIKKKNGDDVTSVITTGTLTTTNGDLLYYSATDCAIGGYANQDLTPYNRRIEGSYNNLLERALKLVEVSQITITGDLSYNVDSTYIQEILDLIVIKFNGELYYRCKETPVSNHIYFYSLDKKSQMEVKMLDFNLNSSIMTIKENVPIRSSLELDTTPTENSTNAITSGAVYTALQNAGGSSVTVDSSITQNGTNPVEGGAIYTALAGKQNTLTIDSSVTQSSTNPVQGGAVYTALGNKADSSTTLSGYGITDAYTKTEVDTALSSKGDVTTNTDQNITGTKTFVGSKKVGFKQSTTNDKLGFTLYGNTGTERGYLEFNPTNTVDGVAGLMTLGNYATSAAGLTQVGFRRYSNISGASGAYNLLMPMVADARTPFSLTTTYTNFYLPLGFKNGSTIVKTDKSGVVDISSLLASLEARVAALEGN